MDGGGGERAQKRTPPVASSEAGPYVDAEEERGQTDDGGTDTWLTGHKTVIPVRHVGRENGDRIVVGAFWNVVP